MEAERYARQRIQDLTQAIAGCLTPDTLARVVEEITENASHPVAEDLADFATMMSLQRDVLG